ncbi:MAG: signal peptidase I [Tetrasphaera sp.]
MTTAPPPSAAGATGAASGTPSRRRKPWPVWVHLVLALVLVALLRNFVAQSFYVPSGSMIPTLQVGDRIIVNKLDHSIERGDVVVFDGTDTFGGNPTTRFDSGVGKVVAVVARVFGINVDEKDYVKRVVGLGGERVACCDAQGRITINGSPLAEPYLAPGVEPSTTEFDVQVPSGRLFLLGDNRENSADSRAHLGDPGGGMVPVEDVIGPPLVRYWPLDRLGGPSATVGGR